MKITNEADYALRIIQFIAVTTGAGGASDAPIPGALLKAPSLTVKAAKKPAALTPAIVDAGTISEAISVPQSFTLKILRKLVNGGLVRSHKGAKGGYALALPPDQITMRAVVELIDGPLTISKCLCDGYECNHATDCGCYFHRVFDEINDMIAEKLENITIATAMEES